MKNNNNKFPKHLPVDLDDLAPFDSFCNELSYHCKTANRMDSTRSTRPSRCAFSFKTRDEFDAWCALFRGLFEANEKQSLFELSETRMKQWVCGDGEPAEQQEQQYEDYDLTINDSLIQAS